MIAKETNSRETKSRPSSLTHLIAGGGAGMVEGLVCHPLDTIKVHMQVLRRTPSRNPSILHIGKKIIKDETILGLYKGLGPVTAGITPKIAIRFASFEAYKVFVDQQIGHSNTEGVFLAGLAAGITEAVLIVTPLEVVKIRFQTQHFQATSSLKQHYRDGVRVVSNILKEGGIRALYRGVILTALRQGTNQAVNFTTYVTLKETLKKQQPQYKDLALPSWQTTFIGLISGSFGPLCNAPIDTIKTRLQKSPVQSNEGAWKRVALIARNMLREEGFLAFYNGIIPRITRVGIGQAISFTVYEFIKDKVENWLIICSQARYAA